MHDQRDTGEARLHPFPVKEIVTFLGGGLGLIYLIGYVSLSARYRALGVPYSSTEIAVIGSCVWEFAFQTVLVASYLPFKFWRDISLVWTLLPYILIVLLIVISAVYLQYGSKLKNYIPNRRWIEPIGLLLGILLGLWHFYANTVPTMGLSSLLAAPQSSLSPFGLFPGYFGRRLAERWNCIRQAIVGHQGSANYQEILDTYSFQLLCILGILLIWGLARKAEPFCKFVRWARRFLVILLLSHALFTPVLHGVILKSYFYPKALIYISKENSGTEFDRRLVTKPPFLLGTTEKDLLLYSSSFGVFIIPRNKVIRIVLLSEEFLFAQ